MKNAFGKSIRRRRESLIPLDPQFGLRQVAASVGIQPSYLSKVERGLVPPPSEATIMRLAQALNLDRDELLAQAGKISPDVRGIVLKRPKLLAGLVRQFAKVSDDGVGRTIVAARRRGEF